MKHSSDPLAPLDPKSLARTAATRSGVLSVGQLPRLAHSTLPSSATETVTWQLRGELRQRAGLQEQVWLHVAADAGVDLQCQRCLEPMRQRLQARRSFEFVADEDAAAELDAQSEHDVLALTPRLDVMELLEDELLLELPLLPRHEHCEMAVPTGALAPEAGPEARTPHPFAALAALKRHPRAD